MSLSAVLSLLLLLVHVGWSTPFTEGDILYASGGVVTEHVVPPTGVELSAKHAKREYNTWEPSDWAYSAWDKQHLMESFAGDYECVQSCGSRKIYKRVLPDIQSVNYGYGWKIAYVCPCPLFGPSLNETTLVITEEQKRLDCSVTNVMSSFCLIRPNCRQQDIERCLKSDNRWGMDGPSYVGEYQGSEVFAYGSGVLPVANGGTS